MKRLLFSLFFARAVLAVTLVNTYTPGTSRNDFTGYVGAKFVATSFTVTTLGIRCLTGNSGTHTVYLLDGANTILASVGISLSGCTNGTFYYGNVSSVGLSNGTTYYLVTDVTNGGQSWPDQNSVTLNAALGSSPQAIFSTTLGSFTGAGLGLMYVGVDINGAAPPPAGSTSSLLLLGAGAP